MAKTASENNHGDEENDRIPISILAQATSDSEWHPTTKETALLPPEAMFGDDYVSSHGAPSDEERAAGGSWRPLRRGTRCRWLTPPHIPILRFLLYFHFVFCISTIVRYGIKITYNSNPHV